MSISAQSRVERGICRLKCGKDRATAFLINDKQAITATHAIKDFYTTKKEIKLEFMNISHEPIVRMAKPLQDKPSSPVVLLQLEESIEDGYYHTFHSNKVKKGDEYEIFGYPVAKWGVGGWLKSTVIRRIEEEMTQPYDWDIDLNHTSNIEDFSGLSGSPLFVNSKLVGVILTQNDAKGKAISLGAISIEKFEFILNEVGLEVKSSLDYDKFLMYELADNMDYSNSMFIAMLESANIFDHEDCQQEFFNAEIAKSSVESKVIDSEVKQFLALKTDVRSVWKTSHRRYKDEDDGNDLLATVYERIEDLSESTLRGNGNFSLTVKKGLLHQLADESKLGWVKNYQIKVQKYLEETNKND